MQRFIEWDSLEVRIRGEKLSEMVRQMIARDPMVERIDLQFSNGLLRVNGIARKFIAIPFTVDITEIKAAGTMIRIPLTRITAGPIPIPTLLVALVKKSFPADVSFEEPATLVLALDRFLPTFVDAELRSIWIIDGGLAVTLGRGGADLPADLTMGGL